MDQTCTIYKNNIYNYNRLSLRSLILLHSYIYDITLFLLENLLYYNFSIGNFDILIIIFCDVKFKLIHFFSSFFLLFFTFFYVIAFGLFYSYIYSNVCIFFFKLSSDCKPRCQEGNGCLKPGISFKLTVKPGILLQ